MIVELLRVQCGCGNQLTGLFDNHHQAIVAGERAGWLMQSESIGGDQCPRCLGCEGNAPSVLGSQVEVDYWNAYDEAVARGVELWEYAADVTAWHDSALALVDLHEEWEAEAQKERDEARAEVERLKVELAAARKECLRVAREQWDTNDNGAIDDADELAAYAEASDLRALAEREAGDE